MNRLITELWALAIRGAEVPSVSTPTLPRVAVTTSPLVSLEAVAIAAGVFSLVVSLLWLAMPPELIWLLVIGLAAKRRALFERGHDLMLVRPRHSPARARGSL